MKNTDGVNLLKETMAKINAYKCNIQREDITYIGDEETELSWDQFVEIAKNFNYDCGPGFHFVPTNLKIYTKQMIFERIENDGMEGWTAIKVDPREHSKKIKLPKNINYEHSCHYVADWLNIKMNKKELLKKCNHDPVMAAAIPEALINQGKPFKYFYAKAILKIMQDNNIEDTELFMDGDYFNVAKCFTIKQIKAEIKKGNAMIQVCGVKKSNWAIPCMWVGDKIFKIPQKTKED